MNSLSYIFLSLLLFSSFGAYSSENISKDQKIIELEKTIEDLRKILPPLYGEIVDSCTASEEEVTSFGAYTLTQTYIDQDWDCIEYYIGDALSGTGGGYWKPSGFHRAVVSSPEKDLIFGSRELTVNDIGDFYHVSGYQGGAWCCEYDYLLSKTAPYKIVFEEISKAESGIQISDFDDDGYQEIQITEFFLNWRGSSTAGSPLPEIYLEYSSDTFKLDKELTLNKAYEKYINSEPDAYKFIAHEGGYEYGWQGHRIPRTLIEVMTSYIMAGREEEAREFLDYVWPDHLTEKELFVSLLKERIESSDYWEY